MTTLHRSAALAVAQVLVRGRVVDRASGRPLSDFTVTLLDRSPNPAVPLDPAGFGLALRRTAEGLFGFFGVPLALPLDKTRQYRWRVEIAAPGHVTAGVNFQFGPLGAQPAPVVIAPAVAGDSFTVPLFTAGLPRDLGDIKLET